MFDPRVRIEEMGRRPVRWALTREGFLLQVLVLLEVLGVNPEGLLELESDLDDGGVARSVNDPWGRMVVEKALSLIP